MEMWIQHGRSDARAGYLSNNLLYHRTASLTWLYEIVATYLDNYRPKYSIGCQYLSLSNLNGSFN